MVSLQVGQVLYAVIITVIVSVDGQGVACWSLPTCTGNLILADLTDCCNNQVEPQGAAFVRSGMEGCFRCPRCTLLQ